MGTNFYLYPKEPKKLYKVRLSILVNDIVVLKLDGDQNPSIIWDLHGILIQIP